MKKLLLILLLPISVLAQNFDFDRRLVLPRALSLAGCANPRISMDESLYYNPASSAHTKMFSSEMSYGWNHISGMPARVDNYSFSALDTSSEFFGGGIAFVDHSISGIGSEWEIKGLVNRTIFKKQGWYRSRAELS